MAPLCDVCLRKDAGELDPATAADFKDVTRTLKKVRAASRQAEEMRKCKADRAEAAHRRKHQRRKDQGSPSSSSSSSETSPAPSSGSSSSSNEDAGDAENSSKSGESESEVGEALAVSPEETPAAVAV